METIEHPKMDGPWGKIRYTEVDRITFIRTNLGSEETWVFHYDPYRWWVFKQTEPKQEIEIHLCGNKIVVRGYGLAKFMEPLEERRLERVAQQTIRFAPADPDVCCVTDIEVESDR